MCAVLATTVAGCGGSIYQPVPVASSAPSANVGPSPTQASFATNGGVSGAVSFPATSSGTANVTIVTSSTPPSGVPTLSASSSARSVQSVNSAGLLYTSLTFSSTITLPSIPALTYSNVAISSGTAYDLAFYDPATGTYNLHAEGPATISGTTLSFSAPAGTFTFKAGVTYVFALYAVTLSPIVPSANTLTFSKLGSAGAQTFTVSEARYSGPFSATSANPAIATVSGPDASGAFTVTPIAGGTTTITVTDAAGQTATIAVSVTTATFIPQ